MKMSVFWNVAPCSVVEVYRRFRGTSCLSQQDKLSSVSVMLEVTVFLDIVPCTNISEVLAASIIRVMTALITLMMKPAGTAETSVNLYQNTQRDDPEDSQLSHSPP
jgi:hypothetical protein